MIKRILHFFHQHMLGIILTIIVIGTAWGICCHNLFVALKPTLPAALFVMLYPMMIGISLDRFKEIWKKPRDTILALLINQVVASLIIGPLVLLSVRSNPKFAAGMILMGVGPLAGSAATFAGIAGGDIAVVVTDVVITMLLSIILVPLWTLLWVGQIVPVPAWSILKSILVYVALPLIAGQLTRWWLIKKYGINLLNENKQYFGPTALIGVFWMVLVVFGLEGGIILKNPSIAVIAVIVMLVFYLLLFGTAIGLGLLFKMKYEDLVALAFGASSKNMSISTAIAIANFGPLAAIGVAMGGPFTEMWLLIALASIFPKFKDKIVGISKKRD